VNKSEEKGELAGNEEEETGSDEGTDEGDLIRQNCNMQGGQAADVSCLQLGAGLDQPLCHLHAVVGA
jgi:hypothetical protein